MKKKQQPKNLESFLEQISQVIGKQERISIGEIHKAIGRRSFGPVLLFPGLVALSPLSGIPGVPTVVGIMIFLITGQLLLGRTEFWMPNWVLRRSISKSNFEKAIKSVRPIAKFIDHLIKPRWSIFTDGPAVYVIAAMCLISSITFPLLEAIPFSATAMGAAISAFGLALIAHDGIVALLAFIIYGGVGFFIVRALV